MIKTQIHGIAFDDDGDVHITYIADGDMKVNGLGQSHTIMIPASATEYGQGIAALMDAARDLLLDAIDDLPRLDAIPLGRVEADAARQAQQIRESDELEEE